MTQLRPSVADSNIRTDFFVVLDPAPDESQSHVLGCVGFETVFPDKLGNIPPKLDLSTLAALVGIADSPQRNLSEFETSCFSISWTFSRRIERSI